MKQRLLQIVTAGALCAAALSAQGHRTPPDPATIVSNQVEHLTTLLTLTTAQQQQATTIFTTAANSETALRTSLNTAHTSLRTAVQNNDTASIDNLTSQIGSLSGQELNIQSKAQAAFYAILTADQKTKFNTLHGMGPGGFRNGPAGAHFGGPRQ